MINTILNIFKQSGFYFAALKYSISSTSNLGGKLDWINENSLNKNIIESMLSLYLFKDNKYVYLVCF